MDNVTSQAIKVNLEDYQKMTLIRLHDCTKIWFSFNPSSRLSLMLLLQTFVAFFCIIKL